MRALTLTPAHLEAYAGELLEQYDTLEVKADGSVYLIRSERADTVHEIHEVADRAGYEPGDEVKITQHASFYTVEVRRLIPPIRVDTRARR